MSVLASLVNSILAEPKPKEKTNIIYHRFSLLVIKHKSIKTFIVSKMEKGIDPKTVIPVILNNVLARRTRANSAGNREAIVKFIIANDLVYNETDWEHKVIIVPNDSRTGILIKNVVEEHVNNGYFNLKTDVTQAIEYRSR